MSDAIIVQGLGKKFSRYHSKRTFTLMEAALSGWRYIRPEKQFWALRDVTFSVAPGKMLGIVGKNGAGKSTLLELIGGVGDPDEGTIKVNGKIGALLDLGVGFHPELTGRENIFVAGVVAGLREKEVKRRFHDIVEFAELENFIESPVRTYSSGMQMRLGFSIAVHTDPQILLIDEFLSVGDLAFQAKCLHRIAEFKRQGCAIILISHKANQIQEFCDEAMWLNEGGIYAYGTPKEITQSYIMKVRLDTEKRLTSSTTPTKQGSLELRMNENRLGSLEVEIIDMEMFPGTTISSGSPLSIEISYQALNPVTSPIFWVGLTGEDGLKLFETYRDTHPELSKVQGKGKVRLYFDRLDLGKGRYFVNVGVYEQNWAYAYDYQTSLYTLTVDGKGGESMVFNPPCHWEISKNLTPIHQSF